jgi:hypothetical protein
MLPAYVYRSMKNPDFQCGFLLVYLLEHPSMVNNLPMIYLTYKNKDNLADSC